MSVEENTRDWICPLPAPLKKKTRNLITRAKPKVNGISPSIEKNVNGRYIMNARTIVSIERFTYPNIEWKSLDLRSSPLVLIGTEVIAMLVLPA